MKMLRITWTLFHQNSYLLIANPIAKSYFNSLNWKLEKVTRWEQICWCCFNGLIKSLWLHTLWLLIAKIYAYGFFINAVNFFYSYLKRRKQNVKISNTHSVFQVLLFGVPQGSILGSLFFNIFINDLYLWITKTDLLNFADDNAIATAERTIENILSTLETESQATIELFKLNEMIANPAKFQVIVVKRMLKWKILIHCILMTNN